MRIKGYACYQNEYPEIYERTEIIMRLLSTLTTIPRLGPILAPASLPLALFGYLVLGLTPMASFWLFAGTNLLWMVQDILKDVSSKRTT
jgi:hypothetical protein